MSTLEIHVTTEALGRVTPGQCLDLGNVPGRARFTGIRQTETGVALRFILPNEPCTVEVDVMQAEPPGLPGLSAYDRDHLGFGPFDPNNPVQEAMKAYAGVMPKAASGAWLCLLCKSGRRGHHGTLDDGVTPCPNTGKPT